MISAVTAVLVVLLTLTVLLSLIGLGRLALVAALLIAAVKASIVAWIFMDLKRAPTVVRITAAAGLFWLIVFLSGTMADYLTRR